MKTRKTTPKQSKHTQDEPQIPNQICVSPRKQRRSNTEKLLPDRERRIPLAIQKLASMAGGFLVRPGFVWVFVFSVFLCHTLSLYSLNHCVQILVYFTAFTNYRTSLRAYRATPGKKNIKNLHRNSKQFSELPR